MERINIGATRGQIETFKESILWNDIVNELRAWQTGFDLEMKSIVDDAADSNPSTASVLLHMGDLNGRSKAIDYVISILDVFLEILAVDKEEEDERQGNDE